MNLSVGLAIGVFLSALLSTTGTAATIETDNQATEAQVHNSGQGTQNDQLSPGGKARLSKRNQAVIKQSEAAMIKNDSAKAKLSKRNQAVIKQTEAAKKRNEAIQKSNTNSTQ